MDKHTIAPTATGQRHLQAASKNPPPGWYVDLYGTGEMRWWDGVRWTREVLACPGIDDLAPGVDDPVSIVG